MLRQRDKFIIAYWLGYLLFYCFYCYFHTVGRYRNSEKIKAEVVDLLPATGRGGVEYTYPEFAFRYNDSVYYLEEDRSYTWQMKLGDKTTVIFLKGEPENARVYNFFVYWVILPRFLLSLMVAIFLFAVLFIFVWYDHSLDEN